MEDNLWNKKARDISYEPQDHQKPSLRFRKDMSSAGKCRAAAAENWLQRAAHRRPKREKS